MSFRSGFNSDLVLHNLRITGELTLDNVVDTSDLEADTLECSGMATVGELDVTGPATFNSTLSVDNECYLTTLIVSGNSQLDTLSVPGGATLSALNVPNLSQLNDLSVSGSATVASVNVSGNSSLNTVAVNGDITVNNETVTPAQLGYVSGVTSDIQSQIDGKIGAADPVFTGLANLPTTQCNGVMYFNNSGGAVDAPMNYDTQYFGGIGTNATGSDGEVDFLSMGYDSEDTSLSAFDWYILTGAATKNLLMRLRHNVDLFIQGLLSTDAITTAVLAVTGQSTLENVSAGDVTTTTLTTTGVSTTTLTATGQSQLANVSASNMTVSGNLTVTGQIVNSVASNMEIVSIQVTGTGGTFTGTLPLTQNATNSTNYTVFPALYYGYSGSSSGTYSVSGAGASIDGEIMISKRTSSSFVYTFTKGTSDSANYWLNCLVVYGAPGASNVPVSNT